MMRFLFFEEKNIGCISRLTQVLFEKKKDFENVNLLTNLIELQK